MFPAQTTFAVKHRAKAKTNTQRLLNFIFSSKSIHF
jgi:hypothetical protein